MMKQFFRISLNGGSEMDIWYLTNKEKTIGLEMEGKVAKSLMMTNANHFLRENSKTTQEPEAPKRTKMYTALQEAAHEENLRYVYVYLRRIVNAILHFQNSANFKYITLFPPPHSPYTGRKKTKKEEKAGAVTSGGGGGGAK